MKRGTGHGVGQPVIDVVGQFLVVGVNRVVSQYRYFYPERIICNDTILESRAKAAPWRRTNRVMFFLEIGF